MSDRFHVITGGPGSGKSSLIAALAAAGVRHRPEAGRAIIRDQMAIGGSALPWSDRAAFAALMLERDLRSYREAMDGDGPVVLDRGIPDIVGYLRLCGLPVPPATMRAAGSMRYAEEVFLAPHWPAIFTQDAERRQSGHEAEATCRVMAETYVALGYKPVPLPLAPLAERLDFIRARIG